MALQGYELIPRRAGPGVATPAADLAGAMPVADTGQRMLGNRLLGELAGGSSTPPPPADGTGTQLTAEDEDPEPGVEAIDPSQPVAIDQHLEAEADRIADEVISPVRSAAEDQGHPSARLRPPPGAVLPRLERAPVPGAARGPAPPPVSAALATPGTPPDSATRRFLEPRLGMSLAHVRLHTDPQAGESAAAMGAQAYTVGRDIVLGPSAPPPTGSAGRHLLAHELAHVMQSSGGAGLEAVHLKRDPGASTRPRPRKIRFRLVVKREMGPEELLREFVRQYYAAETEDEVTRRLPLWHWQRPGGRSATRKDVHRGYLVLPVVDATQVAFEAMSTAQQQAINAEVDTRFWRQADLEPDTKIGSTPADEPKARQWLGIRADVIHENELSRQIAALPPDIKRILFAGGRQVSPADYETILRLAERLSRLTRAERQDYLGRVNAGTTNFADLDASIDRYLLGQRVRASEAERTEAAAATLFGCEDLYRLYRSRKERARLASRMWAISPGMIVFAVAPGPDEDASAFEEALARHGFADEAAFEAAIEAYRLRFRAEAVQLGLDVLAHYEHLLYLERLTLQDLARVEAITQGIAKTSARADYEEARAQTRIGGLGMSASMLTYGGVNSAAVTSIIEGQKLRAKAEQEVVSGSGKDPIVDPQQLGRGTDREKLAGLEAPEAQRYLLEVIQDRLRDTGRARYEFVTYPERIFTVPDLVQETMDSQGLIERSGEADNIYAWIVKDHIADERSAHLFSAIAIGILVLALAVLVPGGGWLGAAAMLANTTISTVQALQMIKEYNEQSVLYRLSFIQDEPSLLWVGVAVAAAALDLGMTTAALLKASAKGLSALESPLKEFAAAADVESAAARLESLSAKIDAVEGLEPEVRQALKARAAAELGLKRALAKAHGSLLGVAGAVDPTPLLEALYYGIKKGANTLIKLRKDAQMLELMGDVTKLTGAGREELTMAFGQVKRIIQVGEQRGMDEATLLGYVDRMAAESAGGEGAFKAIIEDMQAWRPPSATSAAQSAERLTQATRTAEQTIDPARAARQVTQEAPAQTPAASTGPAQATGAAPAAARPRHLEEIISPAGEFAANHPFLASQYQEYVARMLAKGKQPMEPIQWALHQTRGAAADYLNQAMETGWRAIRRERYPGYNPAMIERPTAAPRAGSSLGEGRVWTEKRVQIDDLRPDVDATGDPFWTFPDLVEGEVLVLPSGTRVWREPGTGFVIEEHPVAASVSARRTMTAGEEVMHPAADVGPRAAGTQRLHGAASPGLGFDSTYSIARGAEEVNQAIENAGIELWVRRLRDNAPDGVQYIFTTGTRRSGAGDLLERTYGVGVLSPDGIVDLASFRVVVGDTAQVSVESVSAEAMLKYGMPALKEQSAKLAPGVVQRVDIPPGLRGRLGFEAGTAAGGEVAPELTGALATSKTVREGLDRLYLNLAMQERTALLGEIEDAVADLERAQIWLQHAAPSDPGIRELTQALDELAAAVRGRRTGIDAKALQRFQAAVKEIVGSG
jgi:hypothetical protein